MMIITWNCQGIRGDLTVDNLLEQNRRYTPDMVILLETKNNSRSFTHLKRRLGMEHWFVVEPRGIGGGLCVFWRDATSVVLMKSEDFLVELKLWDEKMNCNWRLFAIYASTDDKKRREQWKEVSKRIGQDRDRCLLLGDFNDILCNEEKEGGNYRPAASLRDFREFVARDELMDLGYEGYPFTWRNKREAMPIQQRLDRGLATLGWYEMYPNTKIKHVILEGSDHALLVLSTDNVPKGKGRQFSYDGRWSKSEDCRNLVGNDWRTQINGSHAYRFCGKLKHLRGSLIAWYKGSGRNSVKRIQQLKEEIRAAYKTNGFASKDPNLVEEVQSCMEGRLSLENIQGLTAMVSDGEILEAAFQIPPTRSPGPDGFSGCFYQDHWDTVGSDVAMVVKAFWHSGSLLRQLNHTNVVLIPKVKCPKNMTQYRPIALCNVIYKIIAKNKGDQPGMAIKLDMAKAYDRVEWEFLLGMMASLGFPPLFCSWIKECISTVSFSVLINGSPTGFFRPNRGLRQGDPLSPFLFLLCTEGLSMLIRRSLERVVFGNASVEEADSIVEIFQTYARGSGQVINKAKSSVFFGAKTPKCLKAKIVNSLGIQSNLGFGKYLGLQADFGHSKKAVFAEIRNKIEARMSGWAEQYLSQAGKEVLVKAVAMALPNYAMSCFRLPIGVCRDVERAIRNYWWRGTDQSKGIHWVSWDRLTKQKKAVLNLGLRWRVGNGKSINIRKEPWFPKPSTYRVIPKPNLEGTMVCDLIDPITKSWRMDLIESGFQPEDVLPILSIPLSHAGIDDRLVWHYTSNGIFSVKTGYSLALKLMEEGALGRKGRGAPSESKNLNLVWNNIWSLQVPNKIKSFIWRCCNNALAVRRNLKRRHMRIDNVCGVCNAVNETENHLFFRCELSHVFWFCSPLHLNSYALEGRDFLESWCNFCGLVKEMNNADDIRHDFAFGLWRLWKHRNEVIFKGIIRQPLDILEAWRKSTSEYKDCLEREDDDNRARLPKTTKASDTLCAKWQKPRFGTIKINSDAAWCKDTFRMGLGWLGRDFAGLLQAAGGTGSGFCHSAAAAEASAIRYALLACIDHGFNDIIIESDASLVIKMLKKEVLVDFSIECILGDIEMLVHKLRNVSFAFVPREGNRAAHSVAKYVFKEGRSFSWDCIGPDFLFNFLAKDVNLSIRL
ncbi:unnamed protein product [Malus baccata var. baccata]